MKSFLISLSGAFLGVTLTIFVVFFLKLSPGVEPHYKMSYADLAAILLTCVSGLVTILGVFLAILAFWGRSQILRDANRSVLEHIQKELEPNGSLRELIVKSCQNTMYEDINKPQEWDDNNSSSEDN